jgi:hypothetical protein
MQNRIANRDDAINFARSLRDKLPDSMIGHDESLSGRSEWTRGIWRFLKTVGEEQDPRWTLYPSSEPQKGRVLGEYLVDFALFDPVLGCRIACESEWGDIDRIDWAFDKLRAIKADIKVLIFQYEHGSGVLPAKVRSRIVAYLTKSHHHHPKREFYVFVQYQGNKAQLFLWEPPGVGPFKDEEILIEPLN